MTKKELRRLAENQTIQAPCGCRLRYTGTSYVVSSFCPNTGCGIGLFEDKLNCEKTAEVAQVVSVGYAMAARDAKALRRARAA